MPGYIPYEIHLVPCQRVELFRREGVLDLGDVLQQHGLIGCGDRQYMVQDHVAHDPGLYLRFEGVLLPQHLCPGLQLPLRKDLRALVRPYRILTEEGIVYLGHGHLAVQSPAGSLLSPFVGVVVAVEAHAFACAVVLPDGFEDGLLFRSPRGYLLIQLRPEQYQLISYDRVYRGDRQRAVG